MDFRDYLFISLNLRAGMTSDDLDALHFFRK